MIPAYKGTRLFRFDWKMTLFVLLLLPVLIRLGFWQLDREAEKRDLQLLYEQRQDAAPRPLSQVNWDQSDIGWSRIRAEGYYDPAHYYLLDNRIQAGQVGYEVLTPFLTDYGVLLINRGWVAAGPRRDILPSIDTPEEKVTIEATVYVPDGELMMLTEESFSAEYWPKRIQQVNLPRLSDTYTEAFIPARLRLSPDSPGAFSIDWQTVNMQPEVHRGYAIQWFLMATALIILYLFFSFRRKEKPNE